MSKERDESSDERRVGSEGIDIDGWGLKDRRLEVAPSQNINHASFPITTVIAWVSIQAINYLIIQETLYIRKTWVERVWFLI